MAKHDSGGNDEEGAIVHALEQLGHHVDRLREPAGSKANRIPGDLLLFHKWHDPVTLRRLQGRIKRVCWYFDLVDFPDPLLAGRNQTRKDWMRDVLPHTDLMFCTDGDWVARDTTGKLVHLTQGADERRVGFGATTLEPSGILFTGIKRGGQLRSSFVDGMSRIYGAQFHHIERGVHGWALATAIGCSAIVVAPDGPATDRYWSNRVYLTLGFGGFLLHPYCAGLAEHYQDGKEIVYYNGRDDLDGWLVGLDGQIAGWLKRPQERRQIAAAGLARTLAQHLYRHRLETLLQTVKERLP